jgi:hypothetical protein
VKATWWDGVDLLWVFPDMDEEVLYFSGRQSYDPYKVHFWMAVGSATRPDFWEWLPER